MKRMTLGHATDRQGVRSSDTGFQHAAMRLESDAQAWRSMMHEVLDRFSLAALANTP
jgi:hypothetical protein